MFFFLDKKQYPLMYEITKEWHQPKPKELLETSPIGQRRCKVVRNIERCTLAPRQ